MRNYKEILKKDLELKEMIKDGARERKIEKKHDELKELIKAEGFEWIKHEGEKLATYTDQIEIIDFEQNCLTKTNKRLTDLEKRMNFALACNR